MKTLSRLRGVFASLMLMLVLAAVASVRATEVLIVVGPTSHPPGSHEVAASARLVQHCLEHMENVPGVHARVFYEWPKDQAVLDRADTVVFSGDTFPPMRLPDSAAIMKQLSAMMDRGCGLVCFHYATGLRAEDVTETGEHPLLHWMGGYFATRCKHHQSVAKIYPQATITPGDAGHPVLRGWKEFTLNDEPYINNYFGPENNRMAPGVKVIATSMLPPESPKREVVAWAVERKDGGRGMGIVMPHFYRNWKIEDLRRCVLNGIVWSAKLEVPKEGVKTTLPDLESFKPESVEPKPAKPKAKSK